MVEIAPYPMDPRYGVTRCGRVYRIVRAKFGRPVPYELVQTKNRKGYPCVGGGHVVGRGLRCVPVHLAVARTFLGAQPPGTEVAHGDGDAGNPHVDNLSWATPAQNQADRLKHGTHNRGSRQGSHKLKEDAVLAVRLGRASPEVVAAQYGVALKHARAVAKGKNWPHVTAR